EEQLLITLGVKDKGPTTQIKALKNELKYLDNQYKTTSNGSKNFEKTTEGLRTKIEYLGKKIEATKTKLDVYKKQMQQAQEGVAKKREEIEKLNQAEGDNSAAISKANKDLEKYQQKMIEAQRNINLTETELRNLETELENTNNALNNQAIVNYQAKMAALSSQLEKTGATLKTLGTTISALGTKMMALASPILALSAYSAKVGMDFEEGMSKVEAISGATAEEMKKLTEKAKEMGVQTKFSATEASEAFKYMAMAGWDAKQMMDGIEGIMNLAAASGEDLALVSDICTDALTAFGLKASDSAHFADVLAKASSSANTNVSMLGESFSYVAPVAGSLGFSVEDTSIALGLMANASVKSSQAGTALRTALINLAKPTSNMKKAMDNCGLSITKSDGSMKSLKEIIDMLRSEMKSMDDDTKLAVLGFDNMENVTELASEAMEDLSEEEIAQAAALDAGMEYIEGWSEAQLDAALALSYSKKELKAMSLEEKQYAVATEQGTRLTEGLTSAQQASRAAQVFGKEAMAGMLTIINASEEDYNNLTNAIYNCDGAAKDMAETMLDNTKGNLTLFKSKLEGLGIQLSAYILPHINNLIDKLSQLVEWFGNLSESTQRNILKFGAYTFGIGAALKVTGKFVSGVGGLVSTGAKLIKFMSSSALVTKALGKNLSATAGTAGALKAGVGALAKAFLPLEMGVVAAGTAIYAVKEHSKAMNNTVLKSSEEMGVLERAFTKMAGGTVYTRKELEQMGLVQEKLSDTMSNEFKDAVNQATSNVQNFNFELKKIRIDRVITPEEIDGLKNRVSELCNSAISTIDSKCSEIQESLGKAFNSDSVLDDDETKILEYYANWGDTNKAEVTRMQGEINEILRKVRDEGYVLTSDDEAKIKNYYAEIQRIELEFQASNNEEILFEKNKFLNRANNLDAESASKMLKERRKYYEEERAEKLAQYDTLINDLTQNLDTMDTETRASAERKIESLKQQKQEQSELLQQYYNEEYEALINQNKNLEEEIDRYSGEILARKDKQNAEELEKLMSHYVGINEITESGMTRLYNTTTQAYENVYVCVDDVTGKIVGLTTFYANETDISANKVTGATKRIENSMNGLSQAAQNDYNNISRALTDTKNTHIDSANQIVNADGRVVGSLREVQTTFGGVKSGIIDINGTPVKIYVDKDGVITNANQIKNALDEAARDRTANIRVHYYSDGRGNVIVNDKVVNGSFDGYASGTKSATRGVHLVGEEGPELIYFSGGETVLDAEKTKNIITSGGYFNSETMESNELINNYNNSYSSTINNYNSNLDMNIMANIVANAVAEAIKGLSINMNAQKVAKIVDNINGSTGAINRRLNGC
ncbi:MAG: phage tail tape measure protein, partial [Intestinibacter sp.]|uniref:phage tail tape measure protein n=1 Tax=Intestinibacter sp. TaxID=1965304 RepID=UPI002A82087B